MTELTFLQCWDIKTGSDFIPLKNIKCDIPKYSLWIECTKEGIISMVQVEVSWCLRSETTSRDY